MNAYQWKQTAFGAAIDRGLYNLATQIDEINTADFSGGIPWYIVRAIANEQQRLAPNKSRAAPEQTETGDKRTLTPRRKCGIIKAIRRHVRRWKRKREGKATKRYEEAQNYIDAGMLKYSEILADCEEIARTDRELKESMVEQAGTVADYAAEIFAAVQELAK